MADYACSNEKSTKKIGNIFEIHENVVCAHKFSWFAKKVVCATCVYDVLGILAVISSTIFVENDFFNKYETAYFLHSFIKKFI